MRFLLLFLLLPLCSSGQQDSLVLRFENDVQKLNAEHQLKLKALLNKPIHKIYITAYMGSNTNPSAHRIRVVRRLQAIKEVCHQYGLGSHQISIQRLVTNREELFDKIILSIQPALKLKANEIHKTPIVSIEKYVASPPRKKTRPKKKLVQEKPKPPVNPYGPFKLEDFKKDEKIIIPKLIFEATRHTLLRSSYPSLRHLLAVLKTKPTMVVQLQGHICCKRNGEDGLDFGTNTGNLSENRAKAVYKYLVDHGISPKRLSYRGFGSKYKLVEDVGNFKKGKVNRRVEVLVISE